MGLFSNPASQSWVFVLSTAEWIWWGSQASPIELLTSHSHRFLFCAILLLLGHTRNFSTSALSKFQGRSACCIMSPTILRAMRPMKSCVIQHQVCPTQNCSRKKQVKKLFISDLPCAQAVLDMKELREGTMPLGAASRLAYVAWARRWQWRGRERANRGDLHGVMSITRVEAPFSERWAICFLREGCGFLVSLQLHHSLPLVLFYLLPAFKENPGGEIFRWVKQGSLFLLKSSVQSISHS